MKRILLAVDGSEHSDRAADLAGELSAGLGAEVDVLHVVPETDLLPARLHAYAHDYTQLEQAYVTRRRLLEKAGNEIVAAAADAVRGAGGKVGAEEVIYGRADQTIASKADNTEADFIVMGRRGLGEVKGLFMGSVSTRVGQLSDRTLITAE